MSSNWKMFAEVHIELADWYLPVQTSQFRKEMPQAHFQAISSKFAKRKKQPLAQQQRNGALSA
jgi:hypothetical protein